LRRKPVQRPATKVAAVNPNRPLIAACVVAFLCGVLYLALVEVMAWHSPWLKTAFGIFTGMVFFRLATDSTREAGIHWGHGVLAACMVCGFLLVQSWAAAKPMKPLPVEALNPTPESAIVSLAADLAMAKMDEGEKLDWPPGMTVEHAARQADFPPLIWAGATEQWERMKPGQQEDFLAHRKRLIQGYHQIAPHSAPREIAAALGWGLLSMGLAFVPASRVVLFQSGA
jgi:hypothetical protein